MKRCVGGAHPGRPGGRRLPRCSPRTKPAPPTRKRIAKAGGEAADLAAEGRYTQATELPARISLGDDLEALNLRLDLASMLDQSGDHPQVPILEDLLADIPA